MIYINISDFVFAMILVTIILVALKKVTNELYKWMIRKHKGDFYEFYWVCKFIFFNFYLFVWLEQ